MADITSEMKRFEQGIKRIWNKLTGGSGSTTVTSNDLAAERGLIKKLQKMDEKYREATKLTAPDYDAIPDSLNLQRKTFVPKTDEELRREAETALSAAYDSKINAANRKALQQTASLEESLAKKDATYAETAEAVGENFKAAEKSLTNSSIDRGLENSSIRTSMESDLRRELDETMSVLKSEHEVAANRIRQEIELAETTRQDAIEEYELSYAADVEKKISALKNDLQKELQAVNSYNAEIAKKEAAYQIKRQKTEDAMRVEYAKMQEKQDEQDAIFEAKYGYTGRKAVEMQERYEEAAAFYETIPNEIARELIAKSEAKLKPLLGLYYSKLKSKIFG